MDMTEEQIIQNAEEYSKKHYDIPFEDNSSMNVEISEESYLAGAHSRDEEIEELNEQLKTCRKTLLKCTGRIIEVETEINKLCNQWISVENRLPEDNCVVFVSLDGTEYLSAHYRAKSKRFVTISKDKQTLVEVRKSDATYTVCGDCIKEERLYSEGQREDITSLVTHWMPIPELKKGE